MNLHPLEIQRKSAKELRQIGLGIMGLADLFIKMNIRYGSTESIELINELGSLISNTALQTSAELAKESGTFPKYNKEYVLKSNYINSVATEETLKKIEKYGLRNSQILTIAPTGSISTLIGASNGVEPIFQISYTRKTESINSGVDTYYKVFTPIVEEYMKAKGINKEEDLDSVIVTSATLNYKERIAVQAAWQYWIDAAISSTVNLPESTTVEVVEDLYIKAWEAGIKGITVYRDNCARAGILTTSNKKFKNPISQQIAIKEDELDKLYELEKISLAKQLDENPTICPKCGGKMNMSGGCSECQDCGYSKCSI